MNILLAYDGSACAEAAIDDLVRAGIPDSADCSVISVAEVWLPPSNGRNGYEPADPYLEELVKKQRERGEHAVAEAWTFSNHAAVRLRQMFPSWRVTSEATYGSPAWEILNRADAMVPDLIVVGSHGQSAISRFLLGSISQKVLTMAPCSVRVARGKIEVDPAPSRIIIGFDGSSGSKAAVDSVASRNWRAGSEVKMISVTDPVSPSAIGRFVPPVVDAAEEINKTERDWLLNAAEPEADRLRRSGLEVAIQIVPGNPKRILTDAAENWNADCIFVGANSYGCRIERYLIGSTSAAVAARAHCSVEVVRRPQDGNAQK